MFIFVAVTGQLIWPAANDMAQRHPPMVSPSKGLDKVPMIWVVNNHNLNHTDIVILSMQPTLSREASDRVQVQIAMSMAEYDHPTINSLLTLIDRHRHRPHPLDHRHRHHHLVVVNPHTRTQVVPIVLASISMWWVIVVVVMVAPRQQSSSLITVPVPAPARVPVPLQAPPFLSLPNQRNQPPLHQPPLQQQW